MYDRPELDGAYGRLWNLISDHLPFEAPDLHKPLDLWNFWSSPNLLLGQTCGLPYRARLHDHVHLVGTPIYDLPETAPGYYFSVIIVNRDDPAHDLTDLAGADFALNDTLSQSGWAALHGVFQDHELPLGRAVLSGSHRASAQMVADGTVRLAAIDAVTWMMLQRYENFTGKVRVLTKSSATPGLPLITARGELAGCLFDAIRQGIDGLSAPDKDALMLRGIEPLPAELYLSMPIPPHPMDHSTD